MIITTDNVILGVLVVFVSLREWMAYRERARDRALYLSVIAGRDIDIKPFKKPKGESHTRGDKALRDEFKQQRE